jgi:glycosyltransferase involved in cell wall biosynthesis
MHTLLIHQAFSSHDQPGGTRHFELARHCVRRGAKFSIVASDISYLTGERANERRGLVTEETIEDVRVLRAYTYPALHRSFAWRVVSFLSFMFTSIVAALRARDVDVVMGTSPPIFQAISACVVAGLRRRPLLLEVRDLWPEFAVSLGVLRNPVLIKLSRLLEMFLYRRATHILVNSPAYRDYIIAKGLPPEKISLISNGVDATMFDPAARGERVRRELNLDGKFVVTYAGALGLANDITNILKAAARLRDNQEIHFLLVGDGKERANLESFAAEHNLPNVTFTGSRPKSEMKEILAASDLCLATLQNIPMFRTTYPNKVFDYMAAGRATVLAIDGVIREVIERARGGVFVAPGDDAALASTIERLSRNPEEAREMGEAARRYVLEHFDRQKQAEDFAALLESIANTKGTGLVEGAGIGNSTSVTQRADAK